MPQASLEDSEGGLIPWELKKGLTQMQFVVPDRGARYTMHMSGVQCRIPGTVTGVVLNTPMIMSTSVQRGHHAPSGAIFEYKVMRSVLTLSHPLYHDK